MDQMKFRLTGTDVAPLLMHNGRLADPMDEFAVAIAEITGKKKKTQADRQEIHWLEWQGGLYWNEELGPYIPRENVESFINDGARTKRRGQDTLRGLVVPEHAVLTTDWPKRKTLREIYDAGIFVDRRLIVNPSTSGRSVRCRPWFVNWVAEFMVVSDPEILDKKDVIEFTMIAGKQVGICDGKPKFGRCKVEVID